jgi:tetratricopeptide (TPR) repeat protein
VLHARLGLAGLVLAVQTLHTLDQYFALGERARRGGVEAAVAELRSWNRTAFRDLRDELERVRHGLESPSARVLVKWERSDIEALAMLHTEAAIRCERLSSEEASHANWAKQLLALFDGLRVDQTFRRRWHVAWGAHLQSTLRLDELAAHLHDALRTWPDDPDLLTMMGSVYESWSHQAVGSRSDSDYLPLQTRLSLERPNRRNSRTRAEASYRRALDVQPGLFDARLRLGRMLLERSQFDEALAQITRASEGAASPKERYLAQLFLGRVHAGAGRWREAVAAYTSAAGLLPDCQSPKLALSHALLKLGAKDEALAEVRIALERSNRARCDDPWWEYEFGYGRRADALFDELREGLRP